MSTQGRLLAVTEATLNALRSPTATCCTPVWRCVRFPENSIWSGSENHPGGQRTATPIGSDGA